MLGIKEQFLDMETQVRNCQNQSNAMQSELLSYEKLLEKKLYNE